MTLPLKEKMQDQIDILRIMNKRLIYLERKNRLLDRHRQGNRKMLSSILKQINALQKQHDEKEFQSSAIEARMTTIEQNFIIRKESSQCSQKHNNVDLHQCSNSAYETETLHTEEPSVSIIGGKVPYFL